MSSNESLSTWFQQQQWQHAFDPETLQAASKLIAKVSQIQGSWEQDEFTLHATVTKLHCEVLLWRDSQKNATWQIDVSCDCSSFFCPHSAALLAAAARHRNLPQLLNQGSLTPNPAALLTPISHPIPAPEPSEDRVFLDIEPHFILEISRHPTDSPTTRLLLQALRIQNEGTWLVARLFANYGGTIIPLQGSKSRDKSHLPFSQNGESFWTSRDAAAEWRAQEKMHQLGLQATLDHPELRVLLLAAMKRDAALPEATFWLPALPTSQLSDFWKSFRYQAKLLVPPTWHLDYHANMGHELLIANENAWMLEIEPTSGDWFSLTAGIDVNGQRIDLLPILADLLKKGDIEESLEFPAQGDFLYHLPNGHSLCLDAARLRTIMRQLVGLIDPRRFAGNSLKLHALDALQLHTQNPDLFPAHTLPPTLEPFRNTLQSFEKLTPATLPQGLRAQLRPYQHQGVTWMQFLATHGLSGILADDMGLGKTLQTLTHILLEVESNRHQGKPTLVIAPTSVLSNWAAEAKKFAPSLWVLTLEGPHRRRQFCSIPHSHIVITSFALLQRDITQLSQHDFHLVILDEAQYIKTAQTKLAHAASQLRSKHRLCLSGTPVENHLGELWSLMNFLMPNYLGPLESFREQYQKPIEKNQDPLRLQQLRDRMQPFILRRTKDEVAKDLPPKTILIHRIELTPTQKDLYETVRATMNRNVRQAIAQRGIEQSQVLLLEALLKLRQTCCDPRLVSWDQTPPQLAELGDAASAKLLHLFDLIETLVAEKRRILLFSQFTSMLTLIENGLNTRSIPSLKLTGESKNRGQLVAQFQNSSIPIFLISLKAGGTGLNLTAADTVIHFDPWWNPAAENQATDRAYRIGQQKPVFVHKLICTNTVEERVHQLQLQKAEVANSILTLGDAALRITSQTMLNLLEPYPSDL